MRDNWQGELKLAQHTQVGEPSEGQIILLGQEDTAPLRLSGFACTLVAHLQEGTTHSDLTELLSTADPEASERHIQRVLDRFLHKLHSNELLAYSRSIGLQSDTSTQVVVTQKKHATIYLHNPERFIHLLSAPFLLLPKVLRWLFAMCCLAVAAGVLIYGVTRGELLIDVNKENAVFILIGGFVIPIWWLLHELGHGIVCKLSGHSVSRVGIRFRGWLLPSPFVDVRSLLLSNSRWDKIHCALAGPFVDILVMSALMSGLLVFSSDFFLNISFQIAFYIVFVGFIFNLSPWRQTDAMVALSHYFKDPLIMHSALYGKHSSQQKPFTRRCYKLIAWLYLAIILTLFTWFIWQVYIFIENKVVAYA